MRTSESKRFPTMTKNVRTLLPYKYLKEILYEIFGFRFLPYKTYEFVKDFVVRDFVG